MSALIPDRGTSEVPHNRRATIVDVARLAGVAPMTVSRALEQFHHSCTQLRVSLNHACAFSADIC